MSVFLEKLQKKMFQPVFEYALGLRPVPRCTDMSAFKGNYFGVFVGVTRSKAQSIPDWPQNIHGSIGYWDRKFQCIEPEPLCMHTHRVAFDAVFNDDRKKYFPSLLTDVDAVLDVKFMCLPIKDVDATTGLFVDGSPFTNNEWGLLVQTNTGRGATFLPKVYIDATWSTIKAHVVSKAGLSGEEGVRFFAYHTKRHSQSLCVIYSLTSPERLLAKFGCCFIKFVNQCADECAHVPYAVTANQTVVYDETQDVRNIATLLDIRRLSSVLPCKARTFSSDIKHYVHKYTRQPTEMRQASTFLLPLLQELNIFPRLQTKIVHRLSTELSAMEPEFELGEALVALKVRQPMRTPRSVFELNWQAQAVGSSDLCDQLRAYVLGFTERTETNYLAVAFEAACALHMSTTLRALFCKLMARYDETRGLFKFLDGSSRIDIAGHVYRGLLSRQSTN
jgi:hypothetical protein